MECAQDMYLHDMNLAGHEPEFTFVFNWHPYHSLPGLSQPEKNDLEDAASIGCFALASTSHRNDPTGSAVQEHHSIQY